MHLQLQRDAVYVILYSLPCLCLSFVNKATTVLFPKLENECGEKSHRVLTWPPEGAVAAPDNTFTFQTWTGSAPPQQPLASQS